MTWSFGSPPQQGTTGAELRASSCMAMPLMQVCMHAGGGAAGCVRIGCLMLSAARTHACWQQHMRWQCALGPEQQAGPVHGQGPTASAAHMAGPQHNAASTQPQPTPHSQCTHSTVTVSTTHGRCLKTSKALYRNISCAVCRPAPQRQLCKQDLGCTLVQCRPEPVVLNCLPAPLHPPPSAFQMY